MKKNLRWLGGAVGALSMMSSPAWAQNYWKPPYQDKGILQWVITMGILVLLCVPGFMNPKRSHMD